MADKPEIKPTCFVIQSFDGGTYDRRYKETVRPALLKAGVEPLRADEILGLNPVVEKIENAIAAASICIAEVSEDNPNVWLEVGYAFALDRPTVILCDRSKRKSLPFDIQHRPIVFYRTDSRSGFEELENNIVKWVKNELSKSVRVSSIKVLRPGAESAVDLEDYEVAALSAAFAFWPTVEGGISHWSLEQKLKELRFSDIALALAVSGLIERGFLAETLLPGDGYGNDEYKNYSITKDGITWIHQNKGILEIRETKRNPKPVPEPKTDPDDDIPF
jgi:hypothetical protein